jgi:membrane protein required for colicin V production
MLGRFRITRLKAFANYKNQVDASLTQSKNALTCQGPFVTGQQAEILIKTETSMNILDILILVILGFCLVRGIFRGIIKELTSIVGVFVGFYIAYNYYSVVANVISRFFTNQAYLNIVSFFLAFTILFLAVGLVGVILKRVFKLVALGWADRLLGATFGFVKAVLIVSILLVPLTAFLPKKSSIVKDSRLAPYATAISQVMVTVVPEEMKEKFGDNINALKEAWKEP